MREEQYKEARRTSVESGLVNKPITSIDNGSSPLLGEYFREKTNLKPLYNQLKKDFKYTYQQLTHLKIYIAIEYIENNK